MQGWWCASSRGGTRAGLNLSTSTSAWAAAGRIGKSLNIWRSCQPSVGRAGDGGLQSGWDASGRFLRSGNRVQPLENQAVGEECTTAIGRVKGGAVARRFGVFFWRSFMQIAIRSDHFRACATPASEAENRAPLSSARFLKMPAFRLYPLPFIVPNRNGCPLFPTCRFTLFEFRHMDMEAPQRRGNATRAMLRGLPHRRLSRRRTASKPQ